MSATQAVPAVNRLLTALPRKDREQLLANCEQTGRLVRNVSGKAPGEATTYEDMWKFTLVNYNAGPGCLGDALEIASGQGQELTWENVAPFLPPACIGAIDYTNDISK